MPITTSVSRWLHILCIMCNMIAFYIGHPVLCEGWNLPHMGKHFRDRIISQRREDWEHKSSLSRPSFYWSAFTKPGKSWFVVLVVSILPFLRMRDLILELFLQCGFFLIYFILLLVSFIIFWIECKAKRIKVYSNTTLMV